ncbi:description family protein, partial [Enterobacter cloacae complex sp. 743-2DZ2F-22B]
HTVETIIAGLDDDDVDDDYINRLIEIEYIRNKKL